MMASSSGVTSLRTELGATGSFVSVRMTTAASLPDSSK